MVLLSAKCTIIRNTLHFYKTIFIKGSIYYIIFSEFNSPSHPLNGRFKNALMKARKNSTVYTIGVLFVVENQLYCEILEFQFVAAKMEIICKIIYMCLFFIVRRITTKNSNS